MKRVLSPEEVSNISKLLLSESEDSAELGYELLKQYPDYCRVLLPELILLHMLGPGGRLQNKLRAFLGRRFKDEYAIWKSQWEIFKKLDYSYSYDAETEAMLKAHETVRKEFEPFVIQNRNYADQYYNIGRILQYRYEKEQELAIEYYDIAIKGNPLNKDAFFNKGYILHIFFKNLPEAKVCYEATLKIDPNYAVAHNNLGSIFNSLQDFDNALSFYSRAFDLSGGNIFYQCNVASALLKLGRNEEFEAEMEQVFKRDQYYQRAMNIWANYLWEHKGDCALAEKFYREGMRFYPNDNNLCGNLGEMYEVAMDRYIDAYDLYVKSLGLKKTLYRLTTMVSLLVLKLEWQDEALSYYEELVAKQKAENNRRDHDLNDQQWEEFLKAEKILLTYEENLNN
jgi:tetratricopeptide (TPR) repeat protein